MFVRAQMSRALYGDVEAWEELKVGMKNLNKWKRIALVTDLDWMITVVSLFGWMTPGELKRFPVAERDKAITWAAEDG